MGNRERRERGTVIVRFKEGGCGDMRAVGGRERLPTKMEGCEKSVQ